ncbi:hypothetical protein G6L09_11450 [Agrobacterium rhizogenes]|nr:hypothetical protein [Rhizobium rhizogenes]NTH71170.1 hypothetical protein [Rhizobium rhizogenes]
MRSAAAQLKWVFRLRMVLLVSAIVATALTGLLTALVVRHGSHAVYCPAGTSFFIFPCTPTPDAIGYAVMAALLLTATLSIVGAAIVGLWSLVSD